MRRLKKVEPPSMLEIAIDRAAEYLSGCHCERCVAAREPEMDAWHRFLAGAVDEYPGAAFCAIFERWTLMQFAETINKIKGLATVAGS